MNPKEANIARIKEERYYELSGMKFEVMRTIKMIQKDKLGSIFIRCKNGEVRWQDAHCELTNIEPYTQITLDYLNMLYETMSNEQKNL